MSDNSKDFDNDDSCIEPTLTFADYLEKLRAEKCNIDRPYIFICYSSKDYEIVYPDVLKLRELGYNIWIDKNMPDEHDNYEWETHRAIEDKYCKAVLFYQSRNSIVSEPVIGELECARKSDITLRNHGDKYGKRPVPVHIIAVDEESSPHGIERLLSDIERSSNSEECECAGKIRDLLYPAGTSKKTISPYKGYKKFHGNEDQYYKNICFYIGEICKKPQNATSDSDIDLAMKSKNENVLPEDYFVDDKHKNEKDAVTLFLDDEKYQGTDLEHAKFIGIVDGNRQNGIIYYNDCSLYKGDLLNFKPQGEGVFRSGKTTITGWFKDGLPDGDNITYDCEYFCFVGLMNDGRFKNGRMEFVDGMVYDGDFEDNHFHGEGTLIYSDKDRYKGAFVDGKREGYGTYTYANGDVIKGEYRNDQLNGEGEVITVSGYHYKGTFKNGLKDGKGTEWYDDDPNKVLKSEYQCGEIKYSEWVDSDGSMVKTLFSSGMVVNKEETDKNGRVVRTGDYQDDILRKQTEYFKNYYVVFEYDKYGKIEKATEFRDGKSRDVTVKYTGLSQSVRKLLVFTSVWLSVLLLISFVIKSLLLADSLVSDLGYPLEELLWLCNIQLTLFGINFFSYVKIKRENSIVMPFGVCVFCIVILCSLLLFGDTVLKLSSIPIFCFVVMTFLVSGTIWLNCKILKVCMIDVYKRDFIVLVLALMVLSPIGVMEFKIRNRNNDKVNTPLNVGDNITMGTYEQDGNLTNGSERLNWTVIDIVDNRYAVLLCDEYIASRPYTLTNDNSWENSDIRDWLNDDFYNAAFSHSEMAVIIEYTITTDLLDIHDLSAVIDSEITNDRVLLPEFSMDYGSGYISETALNDYLQHTEYEEYEPYFWIRNPMITGENLSIMYFNDRARLGPMEPTGYALVRPEIYVDMSLYDYYSEYFESSAN